MCVVAPDYEFLGGQEFKSLRARHLVLICEPDSPAALSGKDGAFQHILAAFDANLVVVDLDDIDE